MRSGLAPQTLRRCAACRPGSSAAVARRPDHLDLRHRAMPIVSIDIALRAASPEKQGSRQRTLTLKSGQVAERRDSEAIGGRRDTNESPNRSMHGVGIASADRCRSDRSSSRRQRRMRVRYIASLDGLFGYLNSVTVNLISWSLALTISQSDPPSNSIGWSATTNVSRFAPWLSTRIRPAVCGRKVVLNSNRCNPVDVKAGKISSVIR